MFSYIFLLITCLMIVKPVGNSLFLVTSGAEQLPYVFVLVALSGASFAPLYSRFSRGKRLGNVILATLLTSVACLLLFWLLLHKGYRHSWLLYTLYVWVALFGTVTGAQYWLLATSIFDSREAKRLFGFLGAGAISGAILGGYLTKLLAERVSTENMLFFCVAALLACVLLFMILQSATTASATLVERRPKNRNRQSAYPGNPVKLITSSRYLQSTAAIIGVGILVATLVEYQFSAISSRVITDTDELTAFFGFWFSTLSVVSLGVQLGLTGPVMKRMGVTASLYFLPLGILAGTFAVLIHPGLGSAVFIKVSDGGLKHSINKAGTELLSLPLIPEIKARVKPFIDVFVDHIASGIAGVVLIVLTIVLGLGVSHISLIIMGLTGIWIYYITSIRREYVNAFRTAIEKRAINLEDQTLNLRNASLFETLVKVLEGENIRQICYVLDLIEDIRDEAFVPHLRNLIRHPSDEVKARVLRLASRYPELDFIKEAEELISSPSQDLRLEAVRFLCWKAGDRRLALEDFQDHPDYRVRASVMMCYAMVVGEKEHPLGSHELKRRLDDMLRETSHRDGEEEQQEFMRANMARVIGVAGLTEHSGTLRKFLADDSPDVLKAALVSAGKLKDQESIPILISHLRTKNMRRYARQSLAEYGEGAIGLLATYFENPSLDRNIRIALPGVLALIDSQKSMDVLTKNLAQKDPAIRYQVIKAMNRIRERFRGRRIDASVVQARILAETQEYQRSFLVLSRLKMSQSASEAQRPAGTEQSEVHDGEQLLIRALEERRDDTLERIFRLLDLLYPPGDMYNAYLGITSGKARLRADAIEFLDNVLTPALKRIIIPLVESAPSTSSFGWARGIPSPVVPSYEDAVDSILESEDVWLKACAVYLIAVFGWTYYTGYVAALTEDEDRILRETALYCQERLGKVGVLHPDIREGAPRLHGN